MAKTNNFIEINGKRYDVTSGVLLDAPGHKKPASKAVKAAKTTKRQPAKSVTPHEQKHAKTLMRQAVKKPVIHPSKTSTQSTNDSLATPPLAAIVMGSSAKQIDPRRLSRAKHVPKSQAIQHFTDLGFTQPLAPNTVIHPTVAEPETRHSKKQHTTADLFDHALKHATGHTQPAHKAKKRSKHGRKLAVGGALAVTALLIGVVGHQASLDLRLNAATATAGFDASLPSYKPPGYSLSQVNYGNDEIATDFHSNSNDSGYSLTRHRTNWDNQALVATFVSPADPKYQTVNTDNKTVYLYGNNNATWISDGIWYVVQTNGDLNARQLLDIVNSL